MAKVRRNKKNRGEFRLLPCLTDAETGEISQHLAIFVVHASDEVLVIQLGFALCTIKAPQVAQFAEDDLAALNWQALPAGQN
jgi:hypothetical protein